MRTALGSTAIPYGSCVEPSNVAALGSACPYRMRCIGCKQFRTDLTHLAALEKYLTDLLAARDGSSPARTSWPTGPSATRCPPMSTSTASGT